MPLPSDLRPGFKGEIVDWLVDEAPEEVSKDQARPWTVKADIQSNGVHVTLGRSASTEDEDRPYVQIYISNGRPVIQVGMAGTDPAVRIEVLADRIVTSAGWLPEEGFTREIPLPQGVELRPDQPCSVCGNYQVLNGVYSCYEHGRCRHTDGFQEEE